MKITEEELQKINEQQNLKANILNKIGLHEAEKHQALHLLDDLSKEIEKNLKELESKYGKITIDLSSGEYEPIEKSSENESNS